MLSKLEGIKSRYLELTSEIASNDVIADQARWQKLVKERSSLEPIAELYDKYRKCAKDLEECKEMLSSGDHDAEFVALIKEESEELKSKCEDLLAELKIALLPKDPKDESNVVMEIRAGAGGDEAGLFGTVLMRMYMRFAERMRWKIEEIDTNMNDLGGVKEVVFMIRGKGAYSKLKFESGVHRVQRVPTTESQGRIHTSTATVAVLPEVEDVDVELNMNDIKVDTYRSSGAGGQHVNKTESAIRMTHLPTGMVVTCQDEKSQIKNRERALKVLKSKLYDYYQSQADKEYAENRRSQVKTGDRSERIRTYNFPQGRVTDHRIGMTVYSLEAFLDGDILSMIEALQLASQNEQLTSDTGD